MESQPELGPAAGLALVSLAVREERGKYILEVVETTNRYNENDGVTRSKPERVHELAFGIVICLVWRQSVTWAAASEGGPLRVFLERKLCKIRAQATDLGCCMALPLREAA